MKKRKHTGVFVALAIITVLIVAPVAAIFGCFYVKDTTEIQKDNTNIQEFSNKMIINSMNNTGSTGTLDFSIPQSAINGVVDNMIQSKLPDQAKNYVDRAYITMDEDYYHIVGNAHAGFFPTKVDLKMKFDTVKEAADPNDWYLQFDIVDASVGRVHGMKSLVTFALGKLKLQESLNNALAASGFHMNIDLSKLQATYTYGDFIKDMKGLVSSSLSIENGELYFQIIEEFIDNGMMDFNFKQKEVASLICNLELFSRGIDPAKSLNLNLEEDVAKRIERLRNAGAIDNTHLLTMFHYFFHGYDYITDEERAYVDTVDFSLAFDTWDKTGYKGVAEELHNGKKLEEVIAEQIPPAPITDPMDPEFLSPENQERIAAWSTLSAKIMTNQEVLHLYESDVDNFVRSTNAFLGYAHLLYDDTSENDFNLTYVAVDNFYTHVRKGRATLNLLMSVNGYDIRVALSTLQGYSDSSYKIVLEVDQLTIGETPTSGELGRSLLRVLQASIVNNNTMYMEIHVNDAGEILGSVEFNFENAVNQDLRDKMDTFNKKIFVSLKPRTEDTENGEYYFSLRAGNKQLKAN